MLNNLNMLDRNVQSAKLNIGSFYFKDPYRRNLSAYYTIDDVDLAYETYGDLSSSKDNAILVFHALSGSQHLAGVNESGLSDYWTSDCHIGWWDGFVGSGKAFNTDEFFVICINYIGACYGSIGPSSPDPVTGLRYGSKFPSITINDIVDSQLALLRLLGINSLYAVVGPSLGGMLALNLSVRYPNMVDRMISVASSMELTPLHRLSRLEQIRAIELDPNFNSGDYYEGKAPIDGLVLARMIAHKSYISLDTMSNRAKSEVMKFDNTCVSYQPVHPVESYMLHHGKKFAKRFDANTYLRIAEAWQYYNLAKDSASSSVAEAISKLGNIRCLVFSIDSDVCFYPEEQRYMVSLMKQAGVTCDHITVHSNKGHDAFLLEPHLFGPYIDCALR